MAASVNDKFQRISNGTDYPNAARVDSPRSAAGTTLVCDDLTGWATTTGVKFVTYRLDTAEQMVSGTLTTYKGVVSGNSIVNVARIKGAADAGNQVNDVVQMIPSSDWADSLIDALLVSLDQDGTLKAGAVDNTSAIADGIVTSAKIADGTIATADIADGAITAAKQGDSGWLNPTFLNGYSTQNSRTVSYRKIGNVVRLRGQIGKATLDFNVMFNLPVGYRPSSVGIYSVPGSSSNYGKLTVDSSGDVNFGNIPSGGTYVGIDGITFTVD